MNTQLEFNARTTHLKLTRNANSQDNYASFSVVTRIFFSSYKLCGLNGVE